MAERKAGIGTYAGILFRDVFIGMILVVVLPITALGALASGNITALGALGAVLLMALLQAAPNAMNNYVDWKIDQANGKRALMHRLFAKRGLLAITAVLLLLTLPFFIYGNNYLRITMLIAYFVIFNYNVLIKAKDVIFLNYLFIAFFYGPLAFAIGFFALSQSISAFMSVVWIPVFIFLIHLIFSVIKDYGDIKGDRLHGKITMPVLFGKKLSVYMQIAATTAIFAALLAFSLYSLRWGLSLALLIPYLIGLYSFMLVLKTDEKKLYTRAANLIRLNALIVTVVLATYFI
ncbi:MAG: UbiA prenyltransferase family protein [Candidatus Micrarchaeota archaeon]|nr:UbiA prenyltransferase family protein [Candidatus Micrarchaeota archaeon]